MFFRQIRSDGSWQFVLDLHPRVTVLSGLGQERQARIAALLEAALHGRAAEIEATLDVDGRPVELSQWTGHLDGALDRLELVIRGTDLPHPGGGDSGDHLRAQDNVGEARAALASATEQVAGARAALAATSTARMDAAGEVELLPVPDDALAERVAEADAAVERAKAAVEDSAQRLSQAQKALDEHDMQAAFEIPDLGHEASEAIAGPVDAPDLAALQGGVDQAVREATRARARCQEVEERGEQARAAAEAARVQSQRAAEEAQAAVALAEEARAAAVVAEEAKPVEPPAVDPSTDEAVVAARQRASDAHAELEPIQQRRRMLGERVAQARRELDDLAAKEADQPPAVAPDPDLVAAMRQAVAEAEAERWDAAFHVGAAGLIQRAESLGERRSRLRATAAPEWLVESAKTALEEAKTEYERLEAMAPARITPEDVVALDQAHRALTDVEERAERRLVSGPLARRRLAAARAEEQAILDRLGVPSYGAFLLRRVNASEAQAGASPEAFERARRALADAEAVWEELRTVEFSDQRTQLDVDEADFLQEAGALLGEEFAAGTDPAVVGEKLVALAHEAPDAADRIAALRGLLATAGVEVADDADVIHAATDWLGAGASHESPSAAPVDERRATLEVLISELTAEEGALNAEHEARTAEATRLAQEAEDAEQAATERLAAAIPSPESPSGEAREVAQHQAEEADAWAQELQQAATEADAGVAAATAQVIALEAERAAADAARDQADAALQEAQGALDRAREVVAALETAAREAEQARLAELRARRERREHELRELLDAAGAAAGEAAATLLEARAQRASLVDAEMEFERRADEALVAQQQLADATRAEHDAQRTLDQAEAAAVVAATRVAEAEERLLELRASAVPSRPIFELNPSADAEIYLLARVAAVRSVGELGSLPLVMVEPLVSLPQEDRRRVLEMVVRMSEIVQVIYLSDDPEIVRWAESLGPRQAAVRRFGRPSPAPAA